MVVPKKTFKEEAARFFEDPSRERLRELLREHLGEMPNLDFKSKWEKNSKLAKHILAMANSGGGVIVVGVSQLDDRSLEPTGLATPAEKSEITNGIKKYLPRILLSKIDILDFHFKESEYPSLIGKAFQVLMVDNDPKYLPFLAERDGEDIRANAIYVRRGTSSEEAGHDEVQNLVNRRLETGYSSRREIDMRSHVAHLQILYESIDPFHVRDRWEEMQENIRETLSIMSGMADTKISNPAYPEESFDEFISRMIGRKKARIEIALDVADLTDRTEP